MRRELILGPCVAFIVVLLAACGSPQAEPTPIPATAETVPSPLPPTPTPLPEPTTAPLGRFEGGEITSQALADNLIGDKNKRRFDVYLPPGYDESDERYPVVYVLHGWRGTYADYTRMGPQLKSLLAAGEAQPMILVFVDGDNAFWGSWYRSSPTIGDYEGYITRELVDLVDSTYRTLPSPESRGITGCSMGAEGAIHLAFKYPDVFGAAAPVSGLYDYDLENDTYWEGGRKSYEGEPESLDFRGMPWAIVWFMGGAAIAAPNPDRAPLYLDMPYELVGGEGQIVPEVYEKITALAPKHEVHDYLDQPLRLRGLLLVHEEMSVPQELAIGRNFDQLLTDLGVEHEYLELDAEHCGGTWYDPVLEFMSDHLEF
ncbi:alpha/beta hydrolase [Chloroflexota bacterium]